MSEWVGGWMGGWVSEWVSEWGSEWVSEWVSEYVRLVTQGGLGVANKLNNNSSASFELTVAKGLTSFFVSFEFWFDYCKSIDSFFCFIFKLTTFTVFCLLQYSLPYS